MTPDLRNEWWLATRVFGNDLCTIFYGVTDVTISRHRMRSAILGRGLSETAIGKENYAMLFERLYGEPL
jgi:hypothetical protein